MKKIMSCLVLIITMVVPLHSFAETVTGPIKLLNVGQKVFSIDEVKYQLAEGVRVKELFNESVVLLFAQVNEGSYFQIEFSASSNQPKKVTKVYLVPQ